MQDPSPTPVTADSAPGPLPGLTPRALALAVALIALGSLWVMKVSLVSHTCQVSEGTPSVPGLMALLLLAGGVVALRYRRGPVRQELLVIYAMVSIGVSLSSDNVMRQLFPAMTSTRYFAGPENDYALFADQIPPWLAVTDDNAAREFCEGSDGGVVPWRAWMPGLFGWGAVFVGLGLGMTCLFAVFQKPWAEHEHLAFPLVQLALDITRTPDTPVGRRGGERAGERHVLGQPLLWVGFALGFIFNASNVAKAFSPQLPAFGSGFDLGALLTQQPWTGMRPLYLAFRPEIVGLGYMVPLDILFSSWVFYLILRSQNFAAQLFGYSVPGFPFDESQAFGAYIGLALMVVYTARVHLRSVLAGTSGGRERAYLWVAGGVFAGLVAWCAAAGVPAGISLAYIGLSVVVYLVYGRIRAQTGLPISYIVPRDDISRLVYDLWPGGGAFSGARLRAESSFAILTVLNRMSFPQLGAFEMEALRSADVGGVRRSHMLSAITVALVAGTLMGYGTHLLAGYEFGNNVLDGGTTVGGYRTRQSTVQLELLQARYLAPAAVGLAPNLARAAGLALTVLLLLLRARFLRFPLHPMGLAIAASFGYHIWFPIFVVWLIKALILRLGGARHYRQLTPLFLGLAVGHMLTAGGIWGLVGTVDEDVGRRYLVWFT